MGAPDSAPDPPVPLGWRTVAGDGPPARWGHIAAWDAKRDRVLIYGGVDEAWERHSDTWAFSLVDEAWVRLEEAGDPPGRLTAAAVADPARDRIVMFGGDADASTSETWALRLDSDTWELLGDGPSARFDVAAAADGQRAWFYGGFADGFVPLGDLHELDLATDSWTELVATSDAAPAPRTNVGFGYHAGHLYVVGGHDDAALTPDAWRYELAGGAWSLLGDTLSLPAQSHFAYESDLECGALWLVGGDNDDSQDVSATIAVSYGLGWQVAALSAEVPIPPHRHGALVLAERRLFAFGGWFGGATVLGDTWVYENLPCPSE